METQQEMVSLKRTSQETGIPLSTLERWAAQGKIEGAKRRLRFLDSDRVNTTEWILPKTEMERIKADQPADPSAIEAARNFDPEEARLLRERAGLSRTKAAAEIGTTAVQLRNWEQAAYKPKGELALKYQAARRRWARQIKREGRNE